MALLFGISLCYAVFVSRKKKLLRTKSKPHNPGREGANPAITEMDVLHRDGYALREDGSENNDVSKLKQTAVRAFAESYFFIVTRSMHFWTTRSCTMSSNRMNRNLSRKEGLVTSHRLEQTRS